MTTGDRPKVVVLIGAGGSFDCWDGRFGTPETDWQPPLVRDFFKRRGFQSLVSQYPTVKPLVVELAKEAESGTLVLEQKLRWYATHKSSEVRRQFKFMPLFLRDVVAACSNAYRDHTGTYGHLFQSLLNYAEFDLLVLTTNYDDLAESALLKLNPSIRLEHMDDYIADDAQCKFVKLHGSIDWAFPMGVAPTGFESSEWDPIFEAFDIGEISGRRDEIVRVPGRGSNSYQWWIPDSDRNIPAYPAVTAPLAGKSDDDLLCPDDHISAAIDFLSQAERVLVIGTSGLDDDVARLLEKGLQDRPKELWFVGRDQADAQSTRDALVERGLAAWKLDEAKFAQGGFVEFVFGDEFKRFYS